jgi:hypothetical protein
MKDTSRSIKKFLEYSVVLCAFAVWICFLHWASYKAFGKSILLWYAKNGFAISWLLTIISAIWGDLNKRPRMISANPYEYMSEYFYFASVFFLVNTQVVKGRGQRTQAAKGLVPYGGVIATANFLFGFPLSICLDIIFLAWLSCLVPIQYFVFLICGAPTRLILETPVKFAVPDALHRNLKPIAVPVDKEVASGWQVFTLHDKPVTVTSAIAGMMFWIVAFLL